LVKNISRRWLTSSAISGEAPLRSVRKVWLTIQGCSAGLTVPPAAWNGNGFLPSGSMPSSDTTNQCASEENTPPPLLKAEGIPYSVETIRKNPLPVLTRRALWRNQKIANPRFFLCSIFRTNFTLLLTLGFFGGQFATHRAGCV
jgi:hypothetical protein